jgi:hypothetical protein
MECAITPPAEILCEYEERIIESVAARITHSGESRRHASWPLDGGCDDIRSPIPATGAAIGGRPALAFAPLPDADRGSDLDVSLETMQWRRKRDSNP